MKRLMGVALLLVVLPFFGCAESMRQQPVPDAAAQQQEVKFVFEAGSLPHVLELSGIVDPSIGSLTFTYEVLGGGDIAFRVHGVRPALQDVKAIVLYRLAHLISEGTMRVGAVQADQFRRKYLFGRAVFEDQRIHQTAGTAKRFGIPEAKVGQWIESYLSVHGGTFKPFPLAPGSQV